MSRGTPHISSHVTKAARGLHCPVVVTLTGRLQVEHVQEAKAWALNRLTTAHTRDSATPSVSPARSELLVQGESSEEDVLGRVRTVAAE